MSSAALNLRNPDKENMNAMSFLKKDDVKKSGVDPKASSRSRRLAVSSALNVDKKNHDERQKTFEELQEETEKMYSELEDYRESNELIAEMIVETDKEMAELEGEYDRLKAFIEDGQKAVANILGCLEEDSAKSDE